jgi:hypothetical protein
LITASYDGIIRVWKIRPLISLVDYCWYGNLPDNMWCLKVEWNDVWILRDTKKLFEERVCVNNCINHVVGGIVFGSFCSASNNRKWCRKQIVNSSDHFWQDFQIVKNVNHVHTFFSTNKPRNQFHSTDLNIRSVV